MARYAPIPIFPRFIGLLVEIIRLEQLWMKSFFTAAAKRGKSKAESSNSWQWPLEGKRKGKFQNQYPDFYAIVLATRNLTFVTR